MMMPRFGTSDAKNFRAGLFVSLGISAVAPFLYIYGFQSER